MCWITYLPFFLLATAMYQFPQTVYFTPLCTHHLRLSRSVRLDAVGFFKRWGSLGASYSCRSLLRSKILSVSKSSPTLQLRIRLLRWGMKSWRAHLLMRKRRAAPKFSHEPVHDLGARSIAPDSAQMQGANHSHSLVYGEDL
jgi:hypothetical protein